MKIRVSVFDDNKKVRDALGMIVKGTDGFEWCGSYSDCSNLIKDYTKAMPDVVLMDIQMPGISGIDAVKELKLKFPDVKILMLTNFDDDDKVFSSICFGASGYLLKNTPPTKILDAVREVYEGGAPMTPVIAQKVLNMFRSQPPAQAVPEKDYHLSPREKEVLECLVKGMSLKMVGEALFISYDTVRTHIKHIYEKLHVVSMTEAVAKAINERLLVLA
jgi:DNA-binding NarL/FixJ family response regulator